MTILGIFGDSYAAEDHTRGQQLYPGWARELREITNYSIHNHAESGSSLYHCWLLFNQYHLNYDRCIIFITHWERYYIESLAGCNNYLHDKFEHIPNLNHLEHLLKKDLDNNLKKILVSLRDYAVWVDNKIQRMNYHKLLIADITRLRPDALLLACFDEESSLYKHPDQTQIKDIMLMDTRFYFGIDSDNTWYNKWIDCRANHMNNLNNKLFAKMIDTWTKTNNITHMKDIEWQLDIHKNKEFYFSRS